MRVSCHSIDVQAILPDQSKEVGSKNSFRHCAYENNTLKLTIAEIAKGIVIQALSGEVNNSEVANILAS